mmetsp:Transcript_44779/g.90451  ORF Transcript_44779/g.90451 Transcript_44779/m.90451 type:complete len:542 (-) Transcript_44779:635-2260(-)
MLRHHLARGLLQVRPHEPHQRGAVPLALPVGGREQGDEQSAVRLREAALAKLEELGQDLKHVGGELSHVQSQHGLKGWEEHGFELLRELRVHLARRSDEHGRGLKQVVVELRVARVLAHALQALVERGEQGRGERHHVFTGHRQTAHHGLHHVLVLKRLVLGLQNHEQGTEQRLQQRLQQRPPEAWGRPLPRRPVLHGEHPLHEVRRVRLHHHRTRAQVQPHERQGRADGVRGELVAERGEKLDAVRADDGQRVHVAGAGSVSLLELGQNVGRDQVEHVDGVVGAGHPRLSGAGLDAHRHQQLQGAVFASPLLRRVGGVLREHGHDVGAAQGRGLGFELPAHAFHQVARAPPAAVGVVALNVFQNPLRRVVLEQLLVRLPQKQVGHHDLRQDLRQRLLPGEQARVVGLGHHGRQEADGRGGQRIELGLGAHARQECPRRLSKLRQELRKLLVVLLRVKVRVLHHRALQPLDGARLRLLVGVAQGRVGKAQKRQELAHPLSHVVFEKLGQVLPVQRVEHPCHGAQSLHAQDQRSVRVWVAPR